MKRTQKRFVGYSFWLIVMVVAGFVVTRLVWPVQGISQGKPVENPASGPVDWTQTLATVTDYVAHPATELVQQDPLSRLQSGDPVFFAQADGSFRQVGMVSMRSGRSSDPPEHAMARVGRPVQILWYNRDVPVHECQFFQHHSTGRLSEVVETLLPPEKQKIIRDELAIAMTLHGEELSRAFVPLVEESLRRSLPVIEDEFRLAVARHRVEINAAAERWNDEVVQQRLIPMARREILPIVKKHGQTPAELIGREIWDRASLFRFGWRAIYDKTPLPRKDLVREEFDRFVEQEAVPIMEQHMDEIVIAIQRSVRDISNHPAVRRELADVAEEIAADPDSRALIQSILKEAFVDNPRLRSVWRDVWSGPEARAAFDIAGERIEPVVREIGDQIFGSEETGINPDFARVLRSQILRKDRRWLVAWHTGANNGVIEKARKSMPYPVVYLAAEELALQSTSAAMDASADQSE